MPSWWAASLDDETEFNHWRRRILESLLPVIVALAAITSLPAFYIALTRGPRLITYVDLASLSCLAWITFDKRLPYHARAAILIALSYVIGVVFLLWIGVVSQIYLLAFPILAALFLGLRPAIIALILNALTLFAVGQLARLNLSFPGVEAAESLMKWGIIALNFAFVDAFLTISCALLLHRLETSFDAQKVALAVLSRNEQKLAVANDELRRQIDARESAEREAARLMRAVEQAAEVILMIDAQGTIVYANEAVEALTGQSRTTIKNMPLTGLFSAVGPSGPESFEEVIANRKQWTGTVRYPHADGSLRELETVISPSFQSDGEIVNSVVVMRDLTREHEIERRLMQNQKLEALGRLAGGIAHDFNNIIGTILGVAELTEREAPSPSVKSGMETIVIACDRAKTVVRQMVSFSRTGAPDRTAISLKAAAEQNLALLRAAIPPNIQIDADLDDECGVVATTAEIQQIVMNLATNAVHAMESKGGTLRLHSCVVVADAGLARAYRRLTEGTRYSMLIIGDTGAGIRAEDVDRVFEPFFTTREPSGGTGLGLATVQGLIASMGGEISLSTEWGRGTTIHIYLPQVQPPDVIATVCPAEPESARGTLLVVDDEPAMLRISERIVRGAGYDVATASSGEAALQLVLDDPFRFDLVLTDLTMTGISGADLTRKLKQIRPELPVILTSGFVDRAGAEEFAALGIAAFVPKPYARVDLLRAISGVLALPSQSMK